MRCQPRISGDGCVASMRPRVRAPDAARRLRRCPAAIPSFNKAEARAATSTIGSAGPLSSSRLLYSIISCCKMTCCGGCCLTDTRGRRKCVHCLRASPSEPSHPRQLLCEFQANDRCPEPESTGLNCQLCVRWAANDYRRHEGAQFLVNVVLRD
jgi:hypothetical protein